MARKNYNIHGKKSAHALFFFSFVLIGAAVLSISKQAELKPILLVAMSAGIMGLYAFCIVSVPATKLRLDVAGDNMYYLGFLYTLSSLAVALTLNEPEQILANFGVAICSTILGIAARVAFNQMRTDPHDVEAASRVELSEATKRVTNELNETITQLTKFRTLSMQVMAEGYEDVQKNVEIAAKDIFHTLKETADKNALVLIELGKNSSAEQTKLSNSIINLKTSNQELVSANKDMVSQMSLASEAYNGLASHYSNTKLLEEKIIKEVKVGLGVVQSEISSSLEESLKDTEQQFHENISQGFERSRLDQEQREINTSKGIMGDVKNNLELFQGKLVNEFDQRLINSTELINKTVTAPLNDAITNQNESQNEASRKIMETLQDVIKKNAVTSDTVLEENGKIRVEIRAQRNELDAETRATKKRGWFSR